MVAAKVSERLIWLLPTLPFPHHYLNPDVIATNMTMPLLHGLEACRQLKQLVGSQIILSTMHADVAYAKEAFQTEASGYLQKRGEALS